MTADNPRKGSGWRGSRDVWMNVAKQVFVETGLDAVKIQTIATRLGIARTSFYWFFKDRDALLRALLEEWEKKNTGAFEHATCAYAETIAEAVLNLIAVFHDESLFEPQFDFAVRSWAHRSHDVMARVNRSDDRRLAAIRRMFKRYSYSPEDADIRARTVYLVQIGYISMQIKEEPRERMARVPGYVETFCGAAPTTREMARFYAQVAYSPIDAPSPSSRTPKF